MDKTQSIYEIIRKENVIKYGTHSSKVMQIIIGEYSDRTHFIYELLQNAEDAGATFIRFHLEKEKLIIIHNGRPFNEDDLRGVCGIADGTKEDGTRIGHFGIGFKSVYAYTDTPTIMSGDYSFHIDQYIFPVEENGDVCDSSLTYIIVPFNKKNVSRKTAFSEISDAFLNKISAETLLMLKNLTNIYIEIEGRVNRIELYKNVKRIKRSARIKRVKLTTNIVGKNSNISKEKEYISFKENKRKSCMLVFAIDGKSLQKVENSRIYSYFPTSRESHQNFYIHAPFDTTPARDNFKEGKEFGKNNIKLVCRLCDLMGSAFLWLQDEGYLKEGGFEKVYPCYKYMHEDLFYPLYEKAVSMIKDEEILIPIEGEKEFSGISKAILPSEDRMRNIIDCEDLSFLLKKEIYWMKTLTDAKESINMHQFLTDAFIIPIYEWKSIIPHITAEYLEKQTVKWLGNFINATRNICNGNHKEVSLIRSLPLVRLKNGKHIEPYYNDLPLVYLNNPPVAEYKISEECLNNITIRNFYEKVLRIPEFSPEREVRDRIIPKYSSDSISFQTKNKMHENIVDLGVIKTAIADNEELLALLKDCYLLYDGKRWRRPSELCLPSKDKADGYNLIRGNEDYPIRYISNRYYKRADATQITEDFLIQLGCHKGLFVYQEECETYIKLYLDSVKDDEEAVKKYKGLFEKKYWTKNVGWEKTFYGFDTLLKDVTRKQSLMIMAFLNAHKDECPLVVDVVFADDGRSKTNATVTTVYSMLGLQIAFSKWIYGKGKRKPCRPIDIDQDDLMTGYYEYPEAIKWLPFKRRNSALTVWLEENFEDPGERNLIKSMLSKPEQVTKIAQKIAKENARSRKRHSPANIGEQFEKADKEQIHTDDTDFEVYGISEKVLERRTKKLEEILKESMKEEISISRSLTFACRKPSPQEKQFLLLEYGGQCQICNQRILDYKGIPYFEAVNILRTNGVFDWKNTGVTLGWNSVCLCPNCAARYKYGSKKISSMIQQIKKTQVVPNSAEYIEINIEMPVNVRQQIRYTPRHFLALQEAIKFFENTGEI